MRRTHARAVMNSLALSRAEILRLAVLFLLVAALSLAAYVMRDALLAGVGRVGAAMQEAPVWGPVIFFLASAASVLFLFLSSVLLVPSAVLVWGEDLTFLLLAGGWLFGWAVTYAIGRFFRDWAIVARRMNQRSFNEASSVLAGKLPFSLVLLVVCSLPAEIPGYLLGAARYPFRRFLLAVALAEIPFAFLIVFLGESFVRENAAGFVVLLVLLAGVLAWELGSARRLRGRR